MVDNESFTGKPQFNIALGYTNFLLYSLHLCSEYSRSKSYSEWFFEQMVLYRWLSTRMEGNIMNIIEGNADKIDKENIKDNFIKMEKFIGEIEPLISGNYNKPIKNRQMYFKLHHMEMFLRKMIKDAGLEMKETDDILEPEEEW